MQHEHHGIIHEFPEYREEIHNLKMSNEHFRELFDEYHKLDREIFRVKTISKPDQRLHLKNLRSEDLPLKDELFHEC